MKNRFIFVLLSILIAACILSSCSKAENSGMMNDDQTSADNNAEVSIDIPDEEHSETSADDSPSEDEILTEPDAEISQTEQSEEQISLTRDPREFVSLYITALREGNAAALNLLYGENRVDTLTADPSIEKDPYAEGDGVNRLIQVDNGYLVCEAVSGSDVYFKREGDCIGYTIYVRDTGERLVIEAVGKYAFEFAICNAEEYIRFPYLTYSRDFCIYLDTGLNGDYFWGEKSTSDYSYSKGLMADVITSTLKKADFDSLKHLYGDFSPLSSYDPSESGEPVAASHPSPFGFKGRAKDVICEEESDQSLLFTVTTQQGETVKLRALLQEKDDGYCLSVIEVVQ